MTFSSIRAVFTTFVVIFVRFSKLTRLYIFIPGIALTSAVRYVLLIVVTDTELCCL